MKIHIRKFPGMRHYITRLGKLVLREGKPPQVFPTVLGGMVGKEITRTEAAEGLRTWRNQSA